MATWDELNKSVGAKPVSISSSWDQANEQAKQIAQENEKTRTESVVETPQEVAVESKGYMAKAMEAGKSVIKYGLDAVNFVNRTYEAGINLAAQPLSRTKFIQEAAAGLDAMERGEVEFNSKAYLGKSLLETLSNPAVATLNTKQGKATVGFISENSSNLPLKTIAAFSAIGDKTYEEAYGAWLTERNDPNNPAWQRFLYEVQDAVPQTLIGVALSLGTAAVTRNAGAGMAVSGAFYTALSADSQIQEKGEVTSLTNLAIDVVGDQVLNRALLGLFGKGGSSNKIIAALGGMGIEGSTEVAQSLLKYANDYGNARTQAQKNEVLADAKNYVLNGGLLMEFGVGAVAGGLATVAVDSVLPTNTMPNRPTTRPNAEERKKMEERINVAIDNQNINEMRDKYADYQLVFDPNDQQDVEIMGAMSETLNDYVTTFNDKTLYVPSETANAPLVEVETVRFPDGQFAARYSVNTENETVGSTFDFKNLHKSQKAASDAAIADLTTQINTKIENTVDEAVLAQLREVLEYASGRKKVPVPTQEERVEGTLGTDELVELQKNTEIYALATEKDEAKALSDIENKVGELFGNLSDVEKAELAADVYDIIRDPKFSSIVADLSLKEIIEQAQRVGSRFQTEDRVEADFERATKAEMADVARFIELVRTEKPVPKSLLADIKDIAAKYGFRDGLSDTELARLFSLRIGRDERLSALQEAGLSDFDAEQATAAEQRKKRAEQAKKRNEKVNEGDVKRLLREIPLLKSVPIQKVRSITTPTGRKAFGRFYMNSIQYVEDADVTTLPHESFHAYSDMALTKAEQQEMYAEARRIYGRQYANDLEIEETLAQDFAVWFVNKKQKPQGFTDRLMEFFNKIAEFFSKFLNKRNRKTLEDIFSDVITEGAAKRVRTTAQKRMTSGDMQAMRVEFFNDPEAFTLKMFSNDIFKKDLVGYIEVKQAIKAMNLKKGEAALHELVLDRPEYKDQKKFDSRQYINAVKSEMLQIRVIESDTYANYGMDNINLDYSPSAGEEPKTYILNTNFEHGRTGHFGRDNAGGLHSHFRAVLMRDDSVFKVLEIQSDTFQRGLEPLTESDIFAQRESVIGKAKSDWDFFTRNRGNDESRIAANNDIGTFTTLRDWHFEEFRKLSELAINALPKESLATLREKTFSQLSAANESLMSISAGSNLELSREYLIKYDEAVRNYLRNFETILSELPLTPADKLRIDQSRQFDSMKNLWYEQNIRMAIRKAAEKGAAFIDFADSKTVAAIEGYIGEEGNQFDGVSASTEVGDSINYLGDYNAIITAINHDDKSFDAVYSESDKVRTFSVADLLAEERERFDDNQEFSNRFYSELKDGLLYPTTDSDKDLTSAELKELILPMVEPEDGKTAEETYDGWSLSFVADFREKYIDDLFEAAMESENSVIKNKAETFKENTLEDWERNYDAEEEMQQIYGDDSVRIYEVGGEKYVIVATEGDTLYEVDGNYGTTSVYDFDIEALDSSQAGIAGKYGVNEIGGKTREGDYYKYIKKTRPDLELHEDDNGFTWWRSAITDADMTDVPLYQLRDGQFPIGANDIKAKNMVARERFDISKLTKISFGGSDRDVYDLGDGKVLKIAKTPRGLDQNLAAVDYYAQQQGMIPEVFEVGVNYLVSKKVNKPDAITKELVRTILVETDPFQGVDTFRSTLAKVSEKYYEKANNEADAEKSALFEEIAILVQSYGDYDMMINDFTAIRNWGTTDEGVPILVDEGTLNKDIITNNMVKRADGSIKQWSKSPMSDPEFAAIVRTSRTAKAGFGDTDNKTFYQSEDDGTSKVYEELAEELERITYEIEVLLDIAGVTMVKNEDGTYRRVSTYPKWIPKELRDKKLLAKVFEKVLKGEPVRGSREEAAYNLMEEYVLSELPPELAQEFVLEQFYNQQYEVADAARAEALSVLQTFVRNLDKKMKKSAKLRTKEVKKVIRTNTGQIRTDTKEFSREMRKRARFFNRGYRTGYKQGAKDKLYALLAKDRVKRDRKGKIETLKRYYKRVKQASRTGSTLPLDYQQRLKEIFEAFDLTTMTQKTKGSLSRTQAWFASQEGDVPKDIAKKLERLDKIPVGKLGDDALEQIINEVTRIFENGVTKKRLQDTRDEKEFADVVERVANSTRDLSRETGRFAGAKKLSYKLFDPTRFADYMDGSNQNYSGANFKELVEPVRIAIDKANIRTDSITADVFAEIEQFGEQYSDEEMARMMHTMALEQGAEKQAEALAEFYKNEKGYDFVSALTPKERGAVEAMRRAFKEIRPEVAGTFEQINNTPFPDIPNYFPLRYDREKELFQIKDQAFDFSITKTSQGFTVNRQPSVGRILDINVFKTFANQMSSQIYYAEVQPALDRTRAIVNSPLYQSKLNRETQDYWKQFVEDVATRGRGTGDFIGKDTMDTLRGNISAAILGYKLSTVMIQPSAVFDSMTAIRQELGAKAVLEVIPRFLKMVFSPAALQAASERSIALRNRSGGTLEIQEMRNATRGIFSDSMWRRGWHSFKSNAYAGIRYTDMRTAASVFDTLVAGYEKKGLDRDAATKRAEQIMMLSQSSANVASRPQILNSASTRFFLPFQSFVINAFNNIRYDAITREFKRNGKIKATLLAISNMQFLAYAVAYEALMYDTISKAFGYDDDEDEQSFLRKMFNSAIGRIPAIGFIVAFDGTVSGKIAANNPVIEAVNANLTALVETAEGDLQAKEAYKAIKGMLTLLGIPATQQIHQILTAPDILGLGSIGMNFGISYDARKIAEKQRDAVMPLFDNNASPELNQDTLAKLAEEVYGTDYTKADIDKKKEKEAALRRQFAIAQEFGFDDPFVNAVVEKTNNNEVKQAFIEQFNTFSNPNAALSRYGRPIRVMGEQEKLLSDELEKELRAIATAPEEDRTRVLELVAEDITDTERKLIIGDDKQFASLAYRRYGVISKEFYESIK